MPEPSLIDGFGRRIDYLRVSVTDRCDMRCSYCMPVGFKGFEEPANWLTHPQSIRLVHLFASLGVRKVRITGGEPLLRRGVVDLARGYRCHPGITDLSLSTNGAALAQHAAALRQAGVQRLNISLDSLDEERFKQLTQRDVLPAVLDGIEAARQASFEAIKLNMVVQPGVNLDELEAMMRFARHKGLVLRLIEPMPMGSTGRATSGCDLTRLGEAMAADWGLLPDAGPPGAGPARYWRDPGSGFSLGVITPMSRHFCQACNRVRLTVDGRLLLCLGQEDAVPLGELMRAGASDQDLVAAIRSGIDRKPERHQFTERPDQVVRFMSATGG